MGIYVPTDAAINWARMPIPKDEVRMRLMDEMRHKSGSLCSRFEWVNVA